MTKRYQWGNQRPSIEKGQTNTMTNRYPWGNQKPSIEKRQTILCPKDTNGVIRSVQLKRDSQYYYDQQIPMG